MTMPGETSSKTTIGVDYEALVAVLIAENDTPLDSVLSKLQQWGVNIHGDLTLYWPIDSYVVAQNISRRAAEVLRLLFADERLYIPEYVGDDATFELTSDERRRTSSQHAIPPRGKLKANTTDRLFLVELHATRDAYQAHEPDLRFDEYDPQSTRIVYFEKSFAQL
jgi:hypothetical protein